jgi:hypothetical protein
VGSGAEHEWGVDIIIEGDTGILTLTKESQKCSSALTDCAASETTLSVQCCRAVSRFCDGGRDSSASLPFFAFAPFAPAPKGRFHHEGEFHDQGDNVKKSYY